MTWTRYRNGRGWRVLDDGRILADRRSSLYPSVAEDDGFEYRTKGEPRSMRQLYADFGPILEHASGRFGVPVNTLMALIAIEATRLDEDKLRFDPRCIRLEPGYESDKRTPNKVSPGLMQTLLSTANSVLSDVAELSHEATVDRVDLFVPFYSIMLGAAYVRRQMNRVEDDEKDAPGADPILNAVAAYNAGSVRFSPDNDWNLLTYGDGRIDKFIAYNNDAVTVLEGIRK